MCRPGRCAVEAGVAVTSKNCRAPATAVHTRPRRPQGQGKKERAERATNNGSGKPRNSSSERSDCEARLPQQDKGRERRNTRGEKGNRTADKNDEEAKKRNPKLAKKEKQRISTREKGTKDRKHERKEKVGEQAVAPTDTRTEAEAPQATTQTTGKAEEEK